MPNSPVMIRILLGAVAAFAVIFLVIQTLKARAERKRRQKLYETENFSPADTFSGTLKHLSGLPVPVGLSLGTAANPAFGMVFAKNRFRYVIEKKDVDGVEVTREPPRLGIPRSLAPRLYVTVRLRDGRTLLFSQRRFSPFGDRLARAMRTSLPPD